MNQPIRRRLVHIGAEFDQTLSRRFRNFAEAQMSVCWAMYETLIALKLRLKLWQKRVLVALLISSVYFVIGFIRCAEVAFSDQPRIAYEPILDWWWIRLF